MSLTDPDRKRAYAIGEIRAAVNIPATRLRVVLYRLGWQRVRERSFGLVVYQAPSEIGGTHDTADIDRLISEVSTQERDPQ